MIEDYFFLDDWRVDIFIAYNEYDEVKIIEALWKLGCNKNQAFQAYNNMRKIKYNIGFTYSNFFLKRTIMVIGLQDNRFQLINTIAHESRHLQQHIAEYKGLSSNGENVCYLLGLIVQILYEICYDNEII